MEEDDTKISARIEPVDPEHRHLFNMRATSFRVEHIRHFEEVDKGEHADALITALKKVKPAGYSLEDVEKVLKLQHP
jgi:RPA family protein